ncbi:carboxymuconolactone decarboxylase family protein [Jiangella ureilytica]|nr:carboxymuconolactone decarboxylase family protein [Jiangella ureilytica]
MEGRELPAGCSPSAYEAGTRFRPATFASRFELLNRLDPHFASVWLNYTGGLLERPHLDVRTRLLILVGQHTMLKDGPALRDTMEAVVAAGVDLKEALEVVFQCWLYAGDSTMGQAVEIFVDVVSRAGRLSEVEARGLPHDVATRDRDLEAERETWSPDDRDDPRLPGLLERYGWHAPSAGLRLRPGNHINVLSTFDALDRGFAKLWVDKSYGAMYVRDVLDGKTRLLCMVGDCLAIAESHNASRHMRGALRQGATAAEVFEVIVQSFAVIGSPTLAGLAIDDFVLVLDGEGRLAELVGEEQEAMVRKVVNARRARRGGVTETTAADGQVT